ncbi:MAG: SGNH/GDSL hydrolase family protein [Candidatus Omnitrophica bacterium]|nr:SGNH/GDSL hydrolase family protein [Candidatus Omnitrophota bacterium]MBU4477873.1 SGNH/GDSL hydrolase family protein [Candidatus Omnitrophota bacterium]MCG2704146.1 SGNH/GDSL hydrolase family protein [Candidatus Omnitrophota bacterium]
MAKTLRIVIGKKKYGLKPRALFVLLALGIVSGLFFGELIARKIFSFSAYGHYMKFRLVKCFCVPDEVLDADLFWRPSPEFRGIKYAIDKKDDVFRIICIGDSVTQGYGIGGAVLPVNQTYPYELELLIQRYCANRKIEVMNAGIGAYSSLQAARYLKRELWKYCPDLVIIWIGVNDDASALFLADKEQKVPSVDDLKKRSIREHSALYLYLRNELFSKRIRRVAPQDYYKNCEDMLLLSREKAFEIAFVIPFAFENKRLKYYSKYKKVLEELRERYNVELLDVKGVLEKSKDIDSLFIDNCHMSAEGNKIVAGIIYDLLEQRLLKLEIL